MDPATGLPQMPAESIRFKDKLGKGACSVVYKGDISKKSVALKVYSEMYSSVCTSEAKLLTKCVHPNIVQALGIVRGDGVALVLEYMNGGSLFRIICNQMSDPYSKLYSNEDGLRWALGIASALASLHERSPAVIHRDIKAENVLFQKDAKKKRHSKLIDFSLATELRPSKLHECSITTGDLSQPCSPYTPLQTSRSASTAHCCDASLSQQIPASQYHGWWQQDRQMGPCTPHTTNTSYGSESSAAFSENSDSDRETATTSGARRLPTTTTAHTGSSGLTSISSSDFCSTSSSSTYNLTGQSGSYAYMAPEVFAEQAYNEKVDVFSFAVLMYEIFARTLVVYAVAREGTEEEMAAHARKVSKGYRMPVCSSIPRPVWALIEECWQQDPELRPSMVQVMERLADLLEGEQGAKYVTAKQLSVGNLGSAEKVGATGKLGVAGRLGAGFLSRASCLMSEPAVEEGCEQGCEAQVPGPSAKLSAGRQLQKRSAQSEEGKTCAIM